MRQSLYVGRKHAFTLVELLVVIGIIALLIAILMPALTAARKAAQSAACLSNVRQIVMAGVLHSTENKSGIYIPTFDYGNDSIAHLWPRYLKNYQVGVCPATMNTIRDNVYLGAAAANSRYGFHPIPRDITDIAPNAGPVNGISYEIWAWYPTNITFTGGREFSRVNVPAPWIQRGVTEPGMPGWQWAPSYPGDTWNSNRESFVIKTNKNTKRPHEVILVIDGDKDGNNPGVKYNNWPDKHNNHGEKGFNAGFADGHAEMIPRGPGMVKAFLDSGNLNPSVAHFDVYSKYPGLRYVQTGSGVNAWQTWVIQ